MLVLSLFLAAAPPSVITAQSIVEAELRDVLRQCRLVTVVPDAPTTDEERSGAEECQQYRLPSRRQKCEDKSARHARRVWEGRLEKLLDDKYLHKHNDNLTELAQHTRSSTLATGVYSCSGEQGKQTCSRRAGRHVRARTGSADAVVLDERLVSECGLVVTYRVSVVDGGMGGPEADVRGSVEGAQVDLYCHAQAEHAAEAACLAAFTTICQTAP